MKDKLCLVCSKDVIESYINVYSHLLVQSDTVSLYDLISQVIDNQDLQEAFKVSEVLCTLCLKLLLSIDSLQSGLKSLKKEFHKCFHMGAERRKKSLVVNQEKKIPEHLARLSNDTICMVDKGRSSGDPLLLVKIEEVIGLKNKEKKYMDEKIIRFTNVSRALGDEIIPSQFLDGPSVIEVNNISKEKNEIILSHTSNCVSAVPETKKNVIQNNHNLGVYLKSEDASETKDTDDTCTDMFESFEDFVKISELKVSGRGPVRRSIRSTRKRKTGLKLQTKTSKKLKADDVQFKTELSKEAQEEDEKCVDDTDKKCVFSMQEDNLMVTCELCGERFSDILELSKHRGYAHATEYSYVCDQCPNVRYREKAKLTQHAQRTHKVQVHQCPGCSHEASSQNALDQHIIIKHPESRYFKCNICNKAFRTYRYLNVNHIKRCHFGLPIKYTCDICGKGFVDMSSFKNHKLTHSDAKNFTCEFCGSLFHTPYALKVHRNTHTQEKKYPCPDCDTVFLRQCNLIAHKRRFHSSDDFKYVCEVCGKSMTTQKDLKRHQISHHSKEKPYTCLVCARTYTSKESLKNHSRTHSSDKPYQCECGKSFHKSNVLRRHQRALHFRDDSADHNSIEKVEVDEEDIEGEEQMVVITLKECNPPAVYTIKNTSTHLQELVVTSEAPICTPNTFLPGTLPQTQTDGTLPQTQTVEGIPMLQHQLGTLNTGRINLAAPVLFTTLSTAPAGGTQENLPQTITTTEISSISSDLQTGDISFHDEISKTSNSSKPCEKIMSIQCEPITCSTVGTQLLPLPPIQTTPNSTQLAYVSSWPFPDLRNMTSI